MNIYAFIPLVAVIAYIPLLVGNLSAHPWRRQHKLFLLFLTAGILWSLVSYISRSNLVPHSSTLLQAIVILFTWMVVQFHIFTSSFFPSGRGRWLPFAYGSLIFITALAILGYLPLGAISKGDMFYAQYGYRVIFVAIPLLILLGRNLYVLVPRLKYQDNPVIYNQTLSLLLCLTILTVFLFSALFEFGRQYPISHIGTVLTAVILNYAVVRRRLVDIKLVIRHGLIWLSIFLVSLICYWALVVVLHVLFNVEVVLSSIGISSLAAVVVAVFAYRLRISITTAVTKIFQGPTFVYRKKLIEYAGQIHNIFSLKEQGGELLRLLIGSFGCRKAALLFLDSGSEDFTSQLVESPESDRSLSEYKLKKDSAIVTYLQRERLPLTSPGLSTLPGLSLQEKSAIEAGKIGLFMPMISRDRLIGILILDNKNTGIYTLEDFSFLEDVTKRVAVSMEKEYLTEQLKEREEELSIINRSSAIITSSLDIQGIYNTFIEELKRVIDVDFAAIAIIEEQELHFMALSSEVGSPWRAGERIPLKGTATEWVAAHHRAIMDADLSVESQFISGKYYFQHNLHSISYVPLTVSNEVIGILIVASRNPGAYNRRHLKLLEQLASQIAMPIENARLYARTERMARVDDLTGLLNRRSLDETLPSEIGRHSRYGGIFSLVLIDIDSFKSFNDNFGHLTGDEVLRQVGKVIKHTIRDADQAFRYGGDEFIILLPQTDIESAKKVAERVRQQISKQIKIASIPITISLGLASWPEDGISTEGMLAAADAALYKAKRNGGNRSEYASGSSLSPAGNAVGGINLENSGALSNIFALAAGVDARGKYSRTHSKRVREYAMALAEGLGMDTSEKKRLGTCALLHDIGKIGISDEILNKQGRLTDQEWETVKAHPNLGATIAGHSSQLSPCISGILHHHERYDGSGYPDGLKGEDIPLESRILAIADAFAAMTYIRAYSEALSYDAAIEEMRKCSNTQFDPKLVEIFLNSIRQVIISEEKEKIGSEKT